jgi:hypothetical protein
MRGTWWWRFAEVVRPFDLRMSRCIFAQDWCSRGQDYLLSLSSQLVSMGVTEIFLSMSLYFYKSLWRAAVASANFVSICDYFPGPRTWLQGPISVENLVSYWRKTQKDMMVLPYFVLPVPPIVLSCQTLAAKPVSFLAETEPFIETFRPPTGSPIFIALWPRLQTFCFYRPGWRERGKNLSHSFTTFLPTTY